MKQFKLNRQRSCIPISPGKAVINIRILTVGLICLLFWLGATVAGRISKVSAQTMVCANLKVDTSDKHRYGARGRNSCEGFYVQHIKQKYLNILSFTWGEYDIEQNQAKEILITAPGAKGDSVWVQSKPIPERIYYRMDGLIPPGGKLTWPAEEIFGPGTLSRCAYRFRKHNQFAWNCVHNDSTGSGPERHFTCN